jgi:hypothetical protein
MRFSGVVSKCGRSKKEKRDEEKGKGKMQEKGRKMPNRLSCTVAV